MEPFREIGEGKKISIPKVMEFGNKDEEMEKMNIRRVEFKDERDEKERKALEEIRCFLSKTKWQKISNGGEERGESGITWIELYALYMCKGAGDQKKEAEKKDPLKPKQSPQQNIGGFQGTVQESKESLH